MRPFLLSDTVGFISDLPTMFIDAFHSTLNEALNADLLLEVIDASDPDRENHIKVTESTLAELGAGNIPIIQIMNKADITPDTVPDSDGTIAVLIWLKIFQLQDTAVIGQKQFCSNYWLEWGR